MRKTLFFLLIATLSLLACSQHSVRHLTSLPWEYEVSRTLPMKYWSFDYTTSSEPNKNVLISGTAWPKKETIPGWGQWIKALNLTVYLCDKKGNVLDSQRKIYQEQSMPYKTGIPFSFSLDQRVLNNSRSLFLTFGYQMEVVKSRYSNGSRLNSQLKGDYDEIFFASQGSILK